MSAKRSLTHNPARQVGRARQGFAQPALVLHVFQVPVRCTRPRVLHTASFRRIVSCAHKLSAEQSTGKERRKNALAAPAGFRAP